MVTLNLFTVERHLCQHNEMQEVQVWLAYLLDWTGLVTEKPVYGISGNKKNRRKAKAPPHKLSPDRIFVIAKRKSWPVHALPDKDNLVWEKKVKTLSLKWSKDENVFSVYWERPDGCPCGFVFVWSNGFRHGVYVGRFFQINWSWLELECVPYQNDDWGQELPAHPEIQIWSMSYHALYVLAEVFSSCWKWNHEIPSGIEPKLDILQLVPLTDCHTHLLTLVAKQDNILYKLDFHDLSLSGSFTVYCDFGRWNLIMITVGNKQAVGPLRVKCKVFFCKNKKKPK